MNDEIREIYLSGLEWAKTHDNMGGVMGNIVFKDNMSYEEYQKLLKTTYFTLCDKDYIINLQQENERANQYIDFYKDLVNKQSKRNSRQRLANQKQQDLILKLQQENERLKDNAIHNDKVVDKARWNEMIYKSRCEKAVEYIKNFSVDKSFSFPLMKRWEENQVKASIDYEFNDTLKKDLLKILQNGSDNDEKVNL